MENAEIHKCFGMQQIFTSLAIALEFEDCLLLMPDRLHSCCTDYLCARCSEGSVVVSAFACNAAGRGSLPGPGAKTIKKNTNSTQNKSQTHRAKQYEVTSFLSTDCELSTETCSKNVYSLGPRRM